MAHLSSEEKIIPPSLREVNAALSALAGRAEKTPCWHWRGCPVAPEGAEIWLKLECLQPGGSFKLRSALLHLDSLSEDQKAKGITAVSAGNHAIAVSYAAKAAGSTAKVVMPRTANPFRVAQCQQLGAEVVLADDVHHAFVLAEDIQKHEGRTFIHPFEGHLVAVGTGTVGWEMLAQVPVLDIIVVPIGGGGLAAGIAAIAKTLKPEIQVWGVEPIGSDSMYRSLAAGTPVSIEKVNTIADSLGAPFALPYSFALCQKYLDGVVHVTDAEMVEAMRDLFTGAKLALEPAAATGLAAIKGPLKDLAKGKRIGLLACGANLDTDTFFKYLYSFPPSDNR